MYTIVYDTDFKEKSRGVGVNWDTQWEKNTIEELMLCTG